MSEDSKLRTPRWLNINPNTIKTTQLRNRTRMSKIGTATIAQEIPQVKIWNPAGEVVGIVTILDQPMNSLTARQSEESFDNKIARYSFGESELMYEVEQDGRLKRGSKRKRAMGELDLGRLQELLQPSFEALNTTLPCGQSETALSWKSQRKRSTSLPPRARDAQSLKDYEASTMSRESPGQRRKPRQHSGGTADDLGDAIVVLSSPTLELEEENPLVSYETEGKVTKVLRVKPNTGRKIKKHSSESNAVTPTREERISQANGNADGENTSDDSKAASKKEDRSWGWSWITGAATVEPRFDPLDIGKPPVHPPAPCAKAMKPPGGGVKPMNTLNSGSIDPAHGPQRLKVFNLTEGHESHRDKRQRTHGGSMLSIGSARELKDRDSQAPNTQNRRESSTAMSGQTFTNNATSTRNANNPVPEYSTVEGMVDPKRRNSRPSSAKRNNSNPSGHTSQQQEQSKSGTSKPKLTPGGSTVVRLDNEDPSDPISDDGLETETDLRPGSTSSRARVVIESSYKGTSNLHPTWNGQDRGPSLTTRYSANRKDRANASSRSGRRANSVGGPRKVENQDSLPRNHSNGVGRKRSSFSPNAQSGLDDSIDHLSAPGYNILADQPAQAIAQDLLSKLGKQQGSSALGKNGVLHSHTVIDDSEDELTGAQNAADIKPTKFDTAKSVKQKRKKKSEDQRYLVMQAFSLKQIWLQHGGKSPWTLFHDLKDGTLTLLDQGENSVLEFPVTSIHHTEYDPASEKIVVHKSNSISDGIGSQVFFEFQDQVQSNAFTQCIKANGCSILLLPKQKEYLDKVFSNKLKQTFKPKKKAPFTDEAEDLKYIKEKQAQKTRRKLDEAQAGKRPTPQGVVDRSIDENYEHLPETRGTSGSRRLRSSSTFTEIAESTKRKTTQSELAPGNFFGNSNNEHVDGHYGTRSSSRVAGRRPPRERTPSPVRWTQQNPNWSDAWKSPIVYPREGKNRATVDMQDIQRLDEGQYLNDSLINFYLRWLEQQLLQQSPELAKRIYFNNTFFYKNLTKVTRSHKGINYEAVERWTAKVDLLSYDYIIVPVNESTHWYVAIICNAPKLLPAKSESSDNSHSQNMGYDTRPREAHMPNHKAEPSTRSPTSPKLAPYGLPEQEMVSFEDLSLRDEVLKIEEEIPQPEADLEPINLIRTTPPHTIAVDGTSDMVVGETIKTSTSKPATASLDFAGDQSKNSTPSKKGKRKSGAPGLRKYDPSEPRIITLDSLGVRHSPTCTNLRDYIMAEIKARRRIEIPPPGSLGTTALNIPQQDNYCDCGLFLLSYIEKFLQEPDEFVHDILQQNPRINDKPWPAASDLRVQIRQLLFDLQEEQATEAEKVKVLKAKGKRPHTIAEKNNKSAAQSDSREASKSVRNSSTPESLRLDDPPPPNRPLQVSPEAEMQIAINRKRSASIDVNKSMDESKRRRQVTPKTGIEEKHLHPGNRPSKVVHDLVDGEQDYHCRSPPDDHVKGTFLRYEEPDQPSDNSFFNDIQGAQRDAPTSRASPMSKVRNLWSSAAANIAECVFSGSETNAKHPEQAQSGVSRMDAVEIHDSPEKTSPRSFLRTAEDLSRQGGISKSPSQVEPGYSKSEFRGREVKRTRYMRRSLQSERARASRVSQSRAPDNVRIPDAKVTGETSGSDDEMLLNGEFGAAPLPSPNISAHSFSSPAGKENLPRQSQTHSINSHKGNHTKYGPNEGQHHDQPWATDGADRAIVGNHFPRKSRISSAANREIHTFVVDD